MAEKILILGESGGGKSTSLRNLNPEDSYIHQCTKKRLPWKGSVKQYNIENQNLSVGYKASKIIQAINFVSQKTDRKYMTVDDIGYYFSLNYADRTAENQFEVFKDLARDFASIIRAIDNARPDLTVFLMGHIQESQTGKISLLTLGKFVDEKLKAEGMFEIVLLSTGFDNDYKFMCNGLLPSKSPIGMFEEHYIENDLQLITNKIKEYYEGE